MVLTLIWASIRYGKIRIQYKRILKITVNNSDIARMSGSAKMQMQLRSGVESEHSPEMKMREHRNLQVLQRHLTAIDRSKHMVAASIKMDQKILYKSFQVGDIISYIPNMRVAPTEITLKSWQHLSFHIHP